MSRPLCPHCLKPHNFTNQQPFVCPETSQEVPTLYLREYAKVPPLWLVAVGFTQHGKTVFLSAMTLMIENIGAAWEDANHRYLDEYTRARVRMLRVAARSGEQPEASRPGRPQPLLMSIYGMPGFSDRCAVIYDTGGEVFESVADLAEHIAAIKYMDTIWFLISLNDLEGQDSRTMVDLFDVYADAMQKHGAELRGRTMIVIYTKADNVPFPEEIRRYLVSDPLSDLTNPRIPLSDDVQSWDMPEYLKEMKEVSQKLEHYTRYKVRGGANFLSSARRMGMEVKFTVTSALGREVGEGNLATNTPRTMKEDASRFRVLDPLIWSLHLQGAISSFTGGSSLPTQKEIILVLDSSAKSDALYKQNFPQLLSESLPYDYSLSTYYLGFNRRMSGPGQAPPPRKAKHNLPRLIGPILDGLERQNSAALVVVVTGGKINDLKDFGRGAWSQRLMLVTLEGDTEEDEWGDTFIYRSESDLTPLVEGITQRMRDSATRRSL